MRRSGLREVSGKELFPAILKFYSKRADSCVVSGENPNPSPRRVSLTGAACHSNRSKCSRYPHCCAPIAFEIALIANQVRAGQELYEVLYCSFL